MAQIGVSGNMKVEPITEADMIQEADSLTEFQREEACESRQVSFGRRLKRLFWHFAARQLMLLFIIAIKIAGLLGRRTRKLLPGEGCEIMLTGRFDADNWILAHLGPLGGSSECSRIWMVSSNPVPLMPKVEAIYPPKWLSKIVGVASSRLLTFLWAAMRKKPHFVGGFHLMYNGIAASIAGHLAGARCVYFCVGGTEVDNGGTKDESTCFMKTATADLVVRKRRLKIVSTFDLIITMGSRAAKFFKDNGIETDIHVVSGGIDANRFHPNAKKSSYDIILVARLSPEKRIDIFLEAIKIVTEKMPQTKAIIVGDGELSGELKQLTQKLGINKNVDFAGHKTDVEEWLRRARIFVLTSDLEGLALSVIEAMMCGLPVVASNVGDLADLVEDGINGYLVPRRSPEMVAARLVELLSDKDKLYLCSQAAENSAMKYETQAAIKRWDNILTGFRVPNTE